MSDTKAQSQDDDLMKFVKTLKKVKDDHRSLILVTNGFLELMVEALIKAKCKNSKRITDDSRSYPYSAKLIILNEIGALSDTQFRELDWFRKIRNDAAHNPFFEVTPEKLQQLAPEWRNPENLLLISIRLFSAFWNGNVDLVPKFLPKKSAS